MRAGNINIKQAAEALGMEPAMLAYQLAGKVSFVLVTDQYVNGAPFLLINFRIGGQDNSFPFFVFIFF